MRTNYLFFYDESGHSRRLTKETVIADNYDDYFVSCIIGVDEKHKNAIEADYSSFEKKR